MPRDLPLSNGRLLVAFGRDYLIRDIYYPHVGKENHATGHPFRFGVWTEGKFSWIGSDWQLDRRYAVDSMVTEVRRSEEHTSELQSRGHLVCRLLLEKKKKKTKASEYNERCVTTYQRSYESTKCCLPT